MCYKRLTQQLQKKKYSILACLTSSICLLLGLCSFLLEVKPESDIDTNWHVLSQLWKSEKAGTLVNGDSPTYHLPLQLLSSPELNWSELSWGKILIRSPRSPSSLPLASRPSLFSFTKSRRLTDPVSNPLLFFRFRLLLLLLSLFPYLDTEIFLSF